MTIRARLLRPLNLILVGVLVLLSTAALGAGPSAAETGPTGTFTTTETITRDHLVDGHDDVTDTRTVKVDVSQTQNLRDQQGIVVSWTGAHPTGGLLPDQNSAAAADEEYPVVVMQCRGIDSASAPASKQISPRTCWTQTPNERFVYSSVGYPPYRMDRYAPIADRAYVAGAPDPVPDCSDVAPAHWVPFVGADGTTFAGGFGGCAGIAPEESINNPAQQPGNTTYGVADTVTGAGSTKFVVDNADSNASLGCSSTVPCSLVVIPIMGISCDAAGTAPAPGGMPAPDADGGPTGRPTPDLVDAIFAGCSATGQQPPGGYNATSADGLVASRPVDLAVTGRLWWAASNWRNRVVVPLTFAPSANICDLVGNSASVDVYGAEAMAQATQQWAPAFCLNPKLFTLHHVQTSEPQAKNLLNGGNIEAAYQGAPPPTAFDNPTVQAPAALTGWAIAYSLDDAPPAPPPGQFQRLGQPYPSLKLNARLLAKLLSQSYLLHGEVAFDKDGYEAMGHNPEDIAQDPEFQALNPGATHVNENWLSASTLSVMSSDSDVMTALTSYLAADPDARAFLDGKPDPWGMVVNPAYKGISLPVANWPLLDTRPYAVTGSNANPCLNASSAAFWPLVAAPTANPATVAVDLQFDIANSQTTCSQVGDTGATAGQKLVSIGRESSGSRVVFGLVSYADAVCYQLNIAALQTQDNGTAGAKFSDLSGRSFVAPNPTSLRAAAALLTPDDARGTWTTPYGTLRTDPRGADAYPGTMLMSTDVPTSGLPVADAARYAAFLRFTAGAGQQAGSGNGQLPPGYLPLTAANGLGAMATYTLAAAAAVAAQHGLVPNVSGKPLADASGPPAGQALPGAAGPSGSVRPPSAASSSPPSASPGSTPSGAPSSLSVATVGRTGELNSGPLALALPLLLIVALVAGGLAAWTGRVGRR